MALQIDEGGAIRLTAANLNHRYLWADAVDQLLADEQVTDLATPGQVLWALADHLGTIRDLAAYNAQTGATSVVNHRVFDAFGNLESETNPAVASTFAFTGRLFDPDTGLQYNYHRWYDPAVGRWISEDPIGFWGRDANLYRYCGNGPTRCIDPRGLEEEHTKNPSPSNRCKHEEGQARKKLDKGNEKGDSKRRTHRKRPPKHTGPWPPIWFLVGIALGFASGENLYGATEEELFGGEYLGDDDTLPSVTEQIFQSNLPTVPGGGPGSADEDPRPRSRSLP